jgi:hypothetical protein
MLASPDATSGLDAAISQRVKANIRSRRFGKEAADLEWEWRQAAPVF